MSSFFDQFQRAAPHIKITGNLIFIEELPKEETGKTVKGADGKEFKLIIASGNQRQLGSIEDDKPFFVRVLDVGQGYYNEEKAKDEPLDTKPGEIILIPKIAVQWISVWGEILSSTEHRIGYTRDSEIIARFTDAAQFQKYKDSLQGR